MGYDYWYELRLTFNNVEDGRKGIKMYREFCDYALKEDEEIIKYADTGDFRDWDGFIDVLTKLIPYVVEGDISIWGDDREDTTDWLIKDGELIRINYKLVPLTPVVIACTRDCTKCKDRLKSVVGECHKKVE